MICSVMQKKVKYRIMFIILCCRFVDYVNVFFLVCDFKSWLIGCHRYCDDIFLLIELVVLLDFWYIRVIVGLVKFFLMLAFLFMHHICVFTVTGVWLLLLSFRFMFELFRSFCLYQLLHQYFRSGLWFYVFSLLTICLFVGYEAPYYCYNTLNTI